MEVIATVLVIYALNGFVFACSYQKWLTHRGYDTSWGKTKAILKVFFTWPTDLYVMLYKRS